MFLSAEATHLTAPVVLVTLLDVSPSAVQNMARHNRPLVYFMCVNITQKLMKGPIKASFCLLAKPISLDNTIV